MIRKMVAPSLVATAIGAPEPLATLDVLISGFASRMCIPALPLIAAGFLFLFFLRLFAVAATAASDLECAEPVASVLSPPELRPVFSVASDATAAFRRFETGFGIERGCLRCLQETRAMGA